MRGALGNMTAWGRLVLASALIAGVAAIAVTVAWATSRETRVVNSVVRGDVEGITLDAADGAVEIVGGGEQADVLVRRTDESAFGHRPEIDRELRGGVLHLQGSCPRGVLTSCEATWRLVIPDNVPVTVSTDDGDIAVRGFRGSAELRTASGRVRVDEFCGFALEVRTETGDVDAGLTCPLARMSLRSRNGDVRASVPAGRYRVDADSDNGSSDVEGLTPADDAPFQVQALSTTGDVTVEGRQ